VPISLYKKGLKTSSQQILNKWKSGEKHCRTHFIQQTFGAQYPEKYIDLSLYVDALINILDDFFDEDLTKEVKGMYIIECLRLMSLLISFSHLSKIQEELGVYFEKLITLALAEDFYEKKISQTEDYQKIIEFSAQLLLCRAQDIEIFTEIALLDYKNKEDKKSIIELSRIFRAINIFKKDINDREHDRSNNIKTVTLTIEDKGIDFKKYSGDLGDYLSKKVKNINKPASQKLLKVFQNFEREIQKEKRGISGAGLEF